MQAPYNPYMISEFSVTPEAISYTESVNRVCLHISQEKIADIDKAITSQSFMGRQRIIIFSDVMK